MKHYLFNQTNKLAVPPELLISGCLRCGKCSKGDGLSDIEIEAL